MYIQSVLVASHTSPQHEPQRSFDIKVYRFEHFTHLLGVLVKAFSFTHACVQDCPPVLSSDFPCIFHQFSIQGPTLRKACDHSQILFLTIHALIGLCGLGIYNASVKRALTSSWVTVPTPAVLICTVMPQRHPLYIYCKD